MQASLLNMKGEEVGKIELKESVFGRKPSSHLLHEFVTVYEANQRRWTANTKTKAEVAGSGKKPWKQKHTGRARAGSVRSPLWRHGGVVFGPRANRGARLSMPRRKSREALAHALSAMMAEGRIIFLDRVELEEPKTKHIAGLLKTLKCGSEKALLVLEGSDEKVSRAGRNVPAFSWALASDLNAYAVLKARRLVFTAPAVEKLSSRWN